MANIKVGSDAEWHSLRESHIGGSEIASLFYLYAHNGNEVVFHMFQEVPEDAICLGCLSPYKSGYRLWQEKAGKITPDDISSNERVVAGQHLEPALAEWAKQKFNLKLRKVRRYMEHDEVKGWGASLDYELIELGMPPAEFKNVDFLVFRDSWVSEGDDIIMPPLHINLQLQTQIGVTDAEFGLIVCCVGGNSLKMGRIPRHEPTQEKIKEAIAAFWQAVESGFEPIHIADFESVAKLYSVGEKDKSIEIPDAETLCARYRRWKKHYDFVEEQLSGIKGKIAAQIGDATRAKAGRFAINWTAVHVPPKFIPAKQQDERNYRGAFTVKEIEK